jgi:hypothetical protein
MLNRQVLGASGVQVVRELGKHLALVGELVAHATADGQVIRYCRVVVGHCAPPGQGSASARNAR